MVYDKTAIIVAVHTWMQNIQLSCDLGCVLGQGYVSVRL